MIGTEKYKQFLLEHLSRNVYNARLAVDQAIDVGFNNKPVDSVATCEQLIMEEFLKIVAVFELCDKENMFKDKDNKVDIESILNWEKTRIEKLWEKAHEYPNKRS